MKTHQRTSEQNGFVSIIVTMIVMIVLTLTVLGFAQLARREQRQSLDRQLSTQALFAAESGVNEAVNQVKNNNYTGEINSCTTPLPPGFNNPQLSSTVSYSCLLLKQKQPSLEYDSISTDNSTYIPIDSDTDITSITIGWGKTASTGLGNNPVNPATKFPSISNWPITGLGVLRFDITATDPAGPFGNELQPSRLGGANKTFFFYPSSGGTSSFPLFSTTTGSIFSGNCGPPSATTSQPCNVTINGVGAIGARRKFFLRLKSIYQPSSVTICVNTCGSGGTIAYLSGAQLSIDVTGKAQDVVKRISVRLPAPINVPSGSLPEFVFDSRNTICKTLKVMPTPAPLSGNANTSSFGPCSIN